MKRTKPQILLLALYDAISWEESFLDSMKGCNTPSDLDAISYAKGKIADYKKMLKKFEAKR